MLTPPILWGNSFLPLSSYNTCSHPRVLLSLSLSFSVCQPQIFSYLYRFRYKYICPFWFSWFGGWGFHEFKYIVRRHRRRTQDALWKCLLGIIWDGGSGQIISHSWICEFVNLIFFRSDRHIDAARERESQKKRRRRQCEPIYSDIDACVSFTSLSLYMCICQYIISQR